MGMILMPGGGGGIDLDVITALAGDVLSGKVIVGPDGEPLTGTLALSGDAAVGNVLTGKTFYAADAKTKLTGTMPNRGKLDWSGNNTTKAVDAGYYSGGTLDSRPSYTAGQNAVKNSPNSYGLYTKAQYDANYNSGVNAGKASFKIKTGSYVTNANDKLNGHRAVTISNIGITPKIAIMWFGTSGFLWIYDNKIYVNCESKTYSTYVNSFSSSKIRVDTGTTSDHTWYYAIAGI